MLFCTPKYLAASSTLISRFSPKGMGIRTPPYRLFGLVCTAGLWRLATAFADFCLTPKQNRQAKESDLLAVRQWGLLWIGKHAGRPQRNAETELAVVTKLMLRGQCFLLLFSSPERGTPKSLASHHIFDQSKYPVKLSCNPPAKPTSVGILLP